MAQFLDKDGLVKLVANTKDYVNGKVKVVSDNLSNNYYDKTYISTYFYTKEEINNDILENYLKEGTDISVGNIVSDQITAPQAHIESIYVGKGIYLLDPEGGSDIPYVDRNLLEEELSSLRTDFGGEIDKLKTKSTSYLGTVSTSTELNNLKPSTIGDFCRVSAAFGEFHNGDLLICRTLPTSSAAAVWDVIHGEMDSNTWVANSKTVDGYVTKGSGQANKVWKTDNDGNPGWRDDNNTTYGLASATANGLMSKEDFSKLSGIAGGATKVVETTVSDWGFTKNTGTVTGIKVSSTSTLSPSGGVVDMSTTLTAKQNRTIAITGFTSTTVEGAIAEALSSAKSYADGIQPEIDAIPLDDITALFAD